MKSTLPLFESGESREIAKRHCRSIGVSIRTLEALVEAELDQVGKQRKRGLRESFDQLLGEEEDQG
jgi:transposase